MHLRKEGGDKTDFCLRRVAGATGEESLMFAEGYSVAQLVSVAMLGSFLRKKPFFKAFYANGKGQTLVWR